jgi:hypothetical protein
MLIFFVSLFNKKKINFMNLTNLKTILVVILLVIIAIFIGGYVISIFWFLIKLVVGLSAIGLIIVIYYFIKHYKKGK